MFKRKPKEHRRPWFQWRAQVGLPECPYLERWMIDLRLFSIRVHHFRSSDDDRALHDHSWDFLTFILKGSYTDVSDTGDTLMKRFSLHFRRAEHKHTVQVGPEGCWTLCLTGPKRRDFGFWAHTKGGKFRWFKANKYFARFGHHPCE